MQKRVQPVSAVAVVLFYALHVCLIMGMHVLMSDNLQSSPINQLPSQVLRFHVSLAFHCSKLPNDQQ